MIITFYPNDYYLNNSCLGLLEFLLSTLLKMNEKMFINIKFSFDLIIILIIAYNLISRSLLIKVLNKDEVSRPSILYKMNSINNALYD